MIILYLCGHNINVNDIRNYFSDSLIKLQSFPNITNNFKNLLTMATTNLEDLLKKVEPKESSFENIARELFSNYCIVKQYENAKGSGEDTYYFKEIEFYLYTNKHTDNRHVYPRICKTGQWFVHYSGVDIAFETKLDGKKINQCGGILIRALRKKRTNEIIAGPLRCLMELFNYSNTFPSIVQMKDFVFYDKDLQNTHRIGFKESEPKKNRFYINEENDKHIIKDVPQYKKDDIVIENKKYTYDFKQADDKPQESSAN